MHFLCNTHRLHLIENPQDVLPAWRRTCRLGREALSEGDWRKAAMMFGNAWEMSDILLLQTPGQSAQQRYVDTSAEMMWALASGHQTQSCRQLFARVLSRLEKEPHMLCSQPSLSLLRDLAFGNNETALARMQANAETFAQRPAYLH